jgi:hypothetical protein
MKKKIFLLLLLSNSYSILNAQTQGPQLVRVTPPSPNVQAFQKYGDIPVSAYTGVPGISIPLYTVKFRDISVPISISYHASGIKVSEEASQIGLGWALNAGGVISRTVIGADDFFGNNYFYANPDLPDPNLPDFADGLGPTRLLQSGCTAELYNKSIPDQPTIQTKYLEDYFGNGYEFQPDQYYYNFQDKSGKFIFKRNRQAILQKQEKIEITCLDNSGNAWQIKDLNGFIYLFDKYETYVDNTTSSTVKSAWYLTKITSPSGNQVTFNYTFESQYIRTIGGYSETRDVFRTAGAIFEASWGGTAYPPQYGSAPGQAYTKVTLSSIDFTNGLVYFNYSDNRNDVTGDKRLESIEVKSRDASGNISTTALKKIIFSYDYFSGGDDPDFSTGYGSPSLRLKLTSVHTEGNYNGNTVIEPPYTFDYHEGDSYTTLPAKTSFARDHWGYYNGKTYTNSLIPTFVPLSDPLNPVASVIGNMQTERNTDPAFSQAFSLKMIHYPTGGSTEFQYESNTYDEQLSTVNDQTSFHYAPVLALVQTTLTYNGGNKGTVYSAPLDLSNEYSFAINGAQSVVTVSATFRFSGGLGGNCNDVNLAPNSVYFELYDAGGGRVSRVDPTELSLCNGSNSPCVSCQSGQPVFTYSNSYSLPAGQYTWKAFAANSGSALKLRDIWATYSYYVPVGTQPAESDNANSFTFLYAGGLRIKKIIDHDDVNAANDKIKKFIYHYTADKNNDGIPEFYSYGRIMTIPRYNYFESSIETMGAGGGGSANWTYKSFHLMRSSDSNIPLNGSASGSVVGYDQVEEWYGENAENGKTIFQYENEPDIVYDYQDGGAPIRPPAGSAVPHPGNGNLKYQADYKNSAGQFILVHDVANSYETRYANENLVYGIEKRPFKFNCKNPQGNIQCAPYTCDLSLLFYHTLNSEWSYLSSTIEKTYNPADTTRYIASITNYYYDNLAHMLPTRTVITNSKKETITSISKYPLDYTISGTANNALALGVKNLQDKHLITPIIEKSVQKTDAGGNNVGILTSLFTSYNTTQTLPNMILKVDNNSPLTNFSPASLTATSSIIDSRYNPYVRFNRYDAFGNIIQQQKEKDILHSYVWGYNNSLPVAEAINAASNEIYFSSFEESGWNMNMQYDNTSHCGSYAGKIIKTTTGELYSHSNTWLNINLTVPTKFHYSGWIYSNAPSVDIYLFMKRAGEIGYYSYVDFVTTSTTNKWVYLEKDFNVPADVTQLNIRCDNNGGGTVWFDDVRIYPSDAQMTTYTYEPLIGMTSQCDVNNKVSYYEYDGLGRLKLIKDQDGNILKTFDYNYKN